MPKPIIGILSNLSILPNSVFPGQEQVYTNIEYVKSVVWAGGIPLLLPVIEDEADIAIQIQQVDGLLLTGGCDINPLAYDEEPQEELGFIFPDVDDHQFAAVRAARRLNKPMFGICRGVQLLNVAFGGTLYQHLDRSITKLKHFQQSKMAVPGHTIKITSGTNLHNIIKKDCFITNSFHHQAVKKLATDFIVNSVALDGTIEGIELNGSPFILGVQWHPERMAAQSPEMLNLFKAFVQQCIDTKSSGK
jgi:putative glutamine amidotransferase